LPEIYNNKERKKDKVELLKGLLESQNELEMDANLNNGLEKIDLFFLE